MNNEIFALVKSLVGKKAGLMFLGLLAVFVVVSISGNIASNILKEQQASAINNSDVNTNSLANIINEKKLESAINQSTNVNCNNNKCVTTICIDNKCHTTTTENVGSANSASSNIAIINIGDPFYKQYDKSTNQKAVVVNGINASQISFSGTGTANGLGFTDTGKALIMPRTGGAIFIQGNAVIKTNSTGEKATYIFQEIGHLADDGMTRASGAAFFGPDATGKLAFLGNLVAVYKDQIDKAGNSKITAWKWK